MSFVVAVYFEVVFFSLEFKILYELLLAVNFWFSCWRFADGCVHGRNAVPQQESLLFLLK